MQARLNGFDVYSATEPVHEAALLAG
jgi:hypothetical protein